MSKTKAYLILEGVSEEITPEITHTNSNFCRFKVNSLQESDIINRNNRRYGWDLMTNALQHDYVKERLNTGTFYCECGHPEEQTIARQTKIDRTNVSCIIKSLELNKPRIGGIVETAATAVGKDLMGLIVHNEAKVAFSMRGLGKVKESRGILDVQAPLRIVCWDEVIHPSVSTAYMNDLITESVNESKPKRFGTSREGLILMEDTEFAKYIFGESTDAQNVADSMGMDVENSAKMIVNEDGTLSIRENGETAVVLTEGFVRNEVSAYLRSLSKKG